MEDKNIIQLIFNINIKLFNIVKTIKINIFYSIANHGKRKNTILSLLCLLTYLLMNVSATFWTHHPYDRWMYIAGYLLNVFLHGYMVTEIYDTLVMIINNDRARRAIQIYRYFYVFFIISFFAHIAMHIVAVYLENPYVEYVLHSVTVLDHIVQIILYSHAIKRFQGEKRKVAYSYVREFLQDIILHPYITYFIHIRYPDR